MKENSTSFYGYVYKITNMLNGKVYIGQRKGKIVNHYYGSGKIIKNALKVHGKENFKREVIAHSSSLWDANQTEIIMIKYYRELLGGDKVYNIMPGGRGLNRTSFKGHKNSKESNEKRRNTLMGHGVSEETRRLMSLKSKGVLKGPFTEEHKLNISTSAKERGFNHKLDCLCRICVGMRKRHEKFSNVLTLLKGYCNAK